MKIPNCPNPMIPCPAPDMYALYRGEKENTFETFPLIFWATTTGADGEVKIQGVDLSHDNKPSFCEEDPDFVGYSTGKEIDEMESGGEK